MVRSAPGAANPCPPPLSPAYTSTLRLSIIRIQCYPIFTPLPLTLTVGLYVVASVIWQDSTLPSYFPTSSHLFTFPSSPTGSL